ncbi:MAG: DsbA family protein [Myxococcota bacterium]
MRFDLRALVFATLPLTACQGGHQAASQRGPGAPELVTSCEAATLRLPSSHVVATVDGTPVLAQDLGEELADAEANALKEYCTQVYSARKAAVDNKVREMLLERAAGKGEQTGEAWLRAQVEAKVSEPSDEEVQRFYTERAPPDAPPLEMVRAQVVDAIRQQRMMSEVETVFAELERTAKITRSLPDVRPPPAKLDAPPHVAFAGATSPVVDVVEFADFECPYCQVMAKALVDVKAKLKDQSVRFSYRHFPLNFHPNARPAAEMAQCAHEQGRFWEMHDRIYDDTSKLDGASLREAAASLGLNMESLDACLASERPGREVELDLESGKRAGVRGTPTLYINGRVFEGRPDADSITAAIREALSNQG